MLLRNMAVSCLGVFMVVYMVDVRGFDLTLATSALALYEFSGVGGALAGGTLSDRFGRRRMVAGATLISALLMLALTQVQGALMIPVLIGLGLTALSVSPVFLALVQDQLPDTRATANGLFMTYAFGIRAINVMIAGALGRCLWLAKRLYPGCPDFALVAATDYHAAHWRSAPRGLVTFAKARPIRRIVGASR